MIELRMIGSRLRALVTVLLAGLILAGPALAPAVAQDKILDASSTDEIVRLLKGYGDAEAVSDGKDGIVAKGRVAETDFTVRQIECRDSQCRGLQFVAAVSRLITEQQANAWNRDKRFGRVLRDELGEARLELAYDMTGGVSAANFADRIDWWVVALKDFIKFLDQPVEEEPKDEPNRSAATDPDDDDPLDEDDATPDPAYSDTTVLTDKASIAEAQEHLSDLGYYEGTFDGKMGKGTEQALRETQTNVGETPTGKLTKGMLARLRNADKPKYWAALAYRANGAYGASWAYPSRRKAVDLAIAECSKHGGQSECAKDVMTASGSFCIAFASYNNDKHSGAHAARRSDLATARTEALRICNENGKSRGKCELRTSFCADASHKKS